MEQSGRWVSPEEQIEFGALAIGYLRTMIDREGQSAALRGAETELAQMIARPAQGEQEPVWYEGFAG